MSPRQRESLRNETKEMFYFAFNNYMNRAYPLDELKPLNCTGRGRDRKHPENHDNDVLGDYMLTLVDTLDTLVVMNDKATFAAAVQAVAEQLKLNQDSRVQVFETTIRVLGGLLSAHLLATDPRMGFQLAGYRNELLSLAYELGLRLMPAFEASPTGIPYSRVNLAYGLPPDELTNNCPAGAGSLILEFGMLSRLTGDPQFERAANRALDALWQRRSPLGLVSTDIDVVLGMWQNRVFTVGAGIDSYLEYLLKAEILFDDPAYGDMFEELYRAMMLHVRDTQGYLYLWIDMYSRAIVSQFVDSLGAFLPGLQVLAGDVDNAIRGHLVYYHIWRKYNMLPERYDFHLRQPAMAQYPLRPEFIESTYFLYRATKNPFYLEVGEMVLRDLQRYARVSCGFTSIENVETKKHANRMESFFLSETLKYLYLLFDEDNIINHSDVNFVFTTGKSAHLSNPT
ncbi:glycoside hydrolase [Thamnocephalis sphaerospora]|uniref:alpha-1,2-Mannosidase n=1 Tax=Thamnocephalis sphaerospora TaxID=78915 RepID=A0A4V1IW19_9FUNG|nr:glycoside hydrolase [Thamnocephalis sphaerospora]|eukprot:RKP06019.1 glycoside hydrolase [Thamnocephalis sphaerospora]